MQVYLFPSMSAPNRDLFPPVSGSNRDLERTDLTGMTLQSFQDNPAEVHLSIRADRNVCAEGPCAGLPAEGSDQAGILLAKLCDPWAATDQTGCLSNLRKGACFMVWRSPARAENLRGQDHTRQLMLLLSKEEAADCWAEVV